MTRPNILIFMTDHQRADTVLDEHPAVMPHVSALAADGVTFTNLFCPSPHCCPARATFHSGLYPSQHGVWNNVCNEMALSRGLKDGVRLWSEDLADAGYRMEWSGKWHVSVEETPKDRGWNEHFVSGYRPREHGAGWENYERIAARGDATERGEGEILRPGYGTYRLYGTRPDDDEPYHDEIALGKALDVLPALAKGSDPWCLFVGAIGPHDPYVTYQKYIDLYDLDDVPLPANYRDDLAGKPAIVQRMRDEFRQLTDREVKEGIRHFWAYCSYLDDQFGQLLARLDAIGEAENTVVVFTSDHGDYCGEHGLFAKGIPCYRGAYHVPAVVRWPRGVVKPGRRVDALLSHTDWAPTFTELAGAKPERAFAGDSLVPFLRNEVPAHWRDAVFTQCNGVELYYTQRSVMTRDWKYVFNGFDRDELYDLANDPHEMTNRADEAALTPTKRDLVRRMWRFARETNDPAIQGYITVSLAPWGPAEAFHEP